MSVRYEATEAAAAATAAQMAGLEKPPRPLGHSRTTSASESASSLGAPLPLLTAQYLLHRIGCSHHITCLIEDIRNE